MKAPVRKKKNTYLFERPEKGTKKTSVETAVKVMGEARILQKKMPNLLTRRGPKSSEDGSQGSTQTRLEDHW